MKTILLLSLLVFSLTSCMKQDNEDLINNANLPGFYIVTQIPFGMVTQTEAYRDVWTLTGDTFTITRYDSVWHTAGHLQVFGKDSLIHFETGVHLNNTDVILFGDGSNPYSNSTALTGVIFFAENNYVSFNPYVNNWSFSLQKITIN